MTALPTRELRFDSAPTSGAHVWIDGQPVGKTPLRLGLNDGPHDLRMGLDGRVLERRVTVGEFHARDFTWHIDAEGAGEWVGR